MALTLTFDESKNTIKTNLIFASKQVAGVIKSYMAEEAKDLEQYMKAHRPWTDRTGAAKANLSAGVTESRMGYRQQIQLAHGVPYGVYLEYAMERRYAIIEPTMRIKGPDIISDLKGRISTVMKVKYI